MANDKNLDLGIWGNILGNYDFNRYGIISMLLLLVGCLSGIAVGHGAINSTGQLIAIVVTTMAALSTILAVSPMKYILNLSLLSILTSVTLIIVNSFA